MILSTRTWGDRSEQAALLVHGGGHGTATWSEVGNWLAERGWHAVAVALRGHGASDANPEEEPSLAAMADDLVETMAAIRPDVEEVDLLLGHSLGAIVSLECMSRHPLFARRLVLEEPASGTEYLDVPQIIANVRAVIQIARNDSEAAAEAYFRGNYSHIDDALRPALIADIAAADPDVISHVLAEIATMDICGLVRECPIPTLVVLGREEDGPLKASAAPRNFSACKGEERAQLCEALRNGRLIELETGHTPHFEALPAFLEALSSWLRDTEPAQA